MFEDNCNLRAFVADVCHLKCDDDLLKYLAGLQNENESLQILLSHMNNMSDLMFVLKKMRKYGFKKCHISYTKNMFQIANRIKQMIHTKAYLAIDKNEKDNASAFEVLYGSLKLALFSTSDNFQMFRKLTNIGRLRGTFQCQ